MSFVLGGGAHLILLSGVFANGVKSGNWAIIISPLTLKQKLAFGTLSSFPSTSQTNLAKIRSQCLIQYFV